MFKIFGGKRNIRDVSTATLQKLLNTGSQDYDRCAIQAELARRSVVEAREQAARNEQSGPLFGPREDVA